MEFVFLGTGAGVPAKARNVSAAALIFPEYGGDMWLFDCGEATQHQILHTKVRLPKIKKIFITHLHGDHIFGLPGLLGSRSFQGGTDDLTLIGPKGIREYVETNLRLSVTHLKYRIHFIELTGDEENLIETKHLSVTAGKLVHGVDSFGYRISEHDQPGELLVDRLKAEGVEPGPIYQRFKTEEVVALDDGREFVTADFRGPVKKGRRIAYLGDTKPCETEISLMKDADLAVHEATFLDEIAENANRFFHTTGKQAAMQAKKAGVKTLLMTHVSSRYQERGEELLEEARSVLPDTHLAEDFWEYTF